MFKSYSYSRWVLYTLFRCKPSFLVDSSSVSRNSQGVNAIFSYLCYRKHEFGDKVKNFFLKREIICIFFAKK